jgi:hypothetical protein
MTILRMEAGDHDFGHQGFGDIRPEQADALDAVLDQLVDLKTGA